MNTNYIGREEEERSRKTTELKQFELDLLYTEFSWIGSRRIFHNSVPLSFNIISISLQVVNYKLDGSIFLAPVFNCDLELELPPNRL